MIRPVARLTPAMLARSGAALITRALDSAVRERWNRARPGYGYRPRIAVASATRWTARR